MGWGEGLGWVGLRWGGVEVEVGRGEQLTTSVNSLQRSRQKLSQNLYTLYLVTFISELTHLTAIRSNICSSV